MSEELGNRDKSLLIKSRFQRYIDDIRKRDDTVGTGVDHIFNTSLTVIQSAIDGMMIQDKNTLSKKIHETPEILAHRALAKDLIKIGIDRDHGRAMVLQLIQSVLNNFGSDSEVLMRQYWANNARDLAIQLSLDEKPWNPFEGISLREKVNQIIKRY